MAVKVIPDEPEHPQELASKLGRPFPDMNLNDAYVDENGIVYAADRQWGGLYSIELKL